MKRYFLISLYLTSFSLFGESKEEKIENNTPLLSQENSVTLSQSFGQVYDYLKTRGVLPYGGPMLRASVDGEFSLAYILWQVNEEGLEYGYSGRFNPTQTPNFHAHLGQGVVLYPDFKLESGFKMGMGIYFSHDRWELDFNYTWLHANAFQFHTFSSTDSAAIPIYDTYFTIPPVFIAPSSVLTIIPNETGIVALNQTGAWWHFQFNALDMELSRISFVSPKMLLEVYYGLKWTRQKQTYTIRYLGPNLLFGQNSSFDLILDRYKIHLKQYYWGFGPRGGVNLDWLITRHVQLFGDMAISCLWGQFRITRNDHAFNESGYQADFQGGELLNTRNRIHGINAVFEMQMGLRYDFYFPDNDYRLRLQGAWESQLWFNQNHWINPGRNTRGDLSLQGMTLSLQLDF
jgi:hypothetical protein